MTNSVFGQVRWPAMAFGSPNCIIGMHLSETTVSEATLGAIKPLGDMDYYFLVDYEGKKFNLSHPELAEKQSFLRRVFSSWSLRMYLIVWQVKQGKSVSVQELRSFIQRDFEANYDIYCEGHDFEKTEDAVRVAATIPELFEALGYPWIDSQQRKSSFRDM